MVDRPRILIVDDEVNIRTALGRLLERRGYEVGCAGSGSEALDLLGRAAFHVVITDLKMFGLDGLGVLRGAREAQPETEVIILTAYGTVDSAVEAMKRGAYDYLAKPMDPDRLALVVEKAVERQRIRAENQRLREELQVRQIFEEVVGKSLAMRPVYEIVEQVAPTSATVLIQGESGTGKELIARSLHQRSERREKGFVAINCGALPESLLESELFGYERGAFTGALGEKRGRIELADGGTLFLDEIGEMNLQSQVGLLRVLDQKEFRRLGGTRLIKVDIRVVAASNQNLDQKVAEGSFREDLFYRLNVVPISVPPLRRRREDIPLLVHAFVQDFAKQYNREPKEISEDAMTLLVDYQWPGNVRELRNVVERLMVTVNDRIISPMHLPDRIRGAAPTEKIITFALGCPIREVERELIRRTLLEVTSHRERAAKILGISPRALHYKMKRFGLGRLAEGGGVEAPGLPQDNEDRTSRPPEP